MKSRIVRAAQMAGLCLTGVATACGGGNTSGDLAAEKFGDLSNPLPVRADAYAEMDEGCALQAPLPAERSPLRRRPYAQKVQQRSAEILWTADVAMGAAEVRVTTPQGLEVTRATGAFDPTARPEGAAQWAARLEGLDPDTLYCYELGAAGTELRRGAFRTAPAPGPGRTIRLVAVGDTGDGGSDQVAVREQMRTVPFDLAVNVGDLAYNVGARSEIERNYFRMYGDLLERIPVFPVSGNHEYETEDAAPYLEAFALPENGGVEGRERWYSFDWGNVHFVALDTERVNATQAAWLDADLTANQLPWTIVFLHRPPYSSGEHGNNPAVQQTFVPLFEKHRVPLVLAGHDHDYERTRPINGVVYVVTGGGGRGTRPVGSSSFTAFSEAVSQFVYVTVTDEAITMHAIDGKGTEFDSLLLLRPAS